MSIINDNITYGDFLTELKTTYEFDQIIFVRKNNYYVYFEGIRAGVVIEVRYNLKDKTYEAFDYSKWLPL